MLGDPRVTAWRSYSVKGNLVAARPRWLREKWGEDAVRSVSAKLTGDAKKLFDSEVLPFGWYDFGTLAAVDQVIIDGPLKGDLSQMKKFGSDVARYDLSSIYKMLLKLGTPSFVAKRVGNVYSTYVRGGSMASEDVESKRARVVLAEGALPLYFCAHGIPGWFTAALELSGAKEVDVRETECVHRGARRCVWQAHWA